MANLCSNLGEDDGVGEDADIVFVSSADSESLKRPSALKRGQMPFIHWEIRSKQLDMEFFLLLKYLLKLPAAHETKLPSSNSAWNKLSADDMRFLWNCLLKSHLRAGQEYLKNGRKPSPDDV